AFDGQVREMTVVFTDLAGFTALTEQLRERTVPILSEYLGLMVPIIRKNEGLVNKFLGDGIMFFYGAPKPNLNHASDAVKACLDSSAEMIAAYVAPDFKKCIEVADQMDKQFGPTHLPALYRKTAQQYLQNPPGPEFNGDLILTEK